MTLHLQFARSQSSISMVFELLTYESRDEEVLQVEVIKGQHKNFRWDGGNGTSRTGLSWGNHGGYR